MARWRSTLTVMALGTLASGLSACGPGPAPTGTPASTPEASMSSSGTTTSVEGVIIEGIAPHCRVLDTGHGRYALVGGDTSLVIEGARVRVTGEHHPELINRCGRTFLVHQVTRID